MTDSQLLAWLLERVDYLEHHDAYGTPCNFQRSGRGYWIDEQTDDDEASDCAGLTLREYVVKMIREGK